MKKANKIGVGTDKHVRTEKGVTIVALVITIVVLIILAGVSINSAINKGLITNAKETKEMVELKSLKEELRIAVLDYDELQTQDKTLGEYLLEKENLSGIEILSSENGNVNGIYKEHYFRIDEQRNIQISSGENLLENVTNMTYTTEN